MASPCIDAEKVHLLISAIEKDFYNWDGFSESLADAFKECMINPTIKYARFYSLKEPFIVVSFSWDCTSLRKVAQVLREKDALGNFVHYGKAVWIDVLCNPQFTDGVTMPRPVGEVAAIYQDAFEHLIFPSITFYRQARCLLELAITSYAGDIKLLAVGDEYDLDWDRLGRRALQNHDLSRANTIFNAESITSVQNTSKLETNQNTSKLEINPKPTSDSTVFFTQMTASSNDELKQLRELALTLFSSPVAFDAAIRAATPWLFADILYRRASQLDFPAPRARETTEAAEARALLERAVVLGHADAACLLGRYQELGRGGLAANASAAVGLYRLAADGGSARGRFCLALALRRGDGGLPQDPAAAMRVYSLAEDGLGTWAAAGARDGVWSAGDLLGVWTWERQGSVRPVEAARREAVRLARLGAARRGGRGAPSAAEQVALAIAGGAGWESFMEEVAAAGDRARAEEEARDRVACGRCAVS